MRSGGDHRYSGRSRNDLAGPHVLIRVSHSYRRYLLAMSQAYVVMVAGCSYRYTAIGERKYFTAKMALDCSD